MNSRCLKCVAGALVSVAAALPFEAPAAPLVSASARSESPQVSDSRAGGTAVADSASPRAAAHAEASFGMLRAYGEATQIPALPLASAFGASAASWFDDVTINAAGRTGQTGSITVSYRIDGRMSFEGAASARSNYSFFVRRGDIIDSFSNGNREIPGAPTADFMNQDIVVTVPIVFGSERQWNFTISLQSTVFGVTASSKALVDMSHTATWLGISAVRDAAGQPVTAFSVASASGTNWAVAAVPEPSAFALGAMGLVMFGALHLRRRAGVRVQSDSRNAARPWRR